MRRLSLGTLVAIVATLMIAVPGSPAAHADGADAYGKGCNPDRYRTRFTVETAKVSPTITYQASAHLSPGEVWQTDETIRMRRQAKVKVSMSYKSSGGVQLSLPGKLLGAVEASTNLQFQGSGNATREREIVTRETRTFRNPDRRAGHKVIFYKGLTRATGRFVKRACFQKYLPGQSYGPYKVHIYYGSFKTWTDHVKLSHVMCGFPVDGKLARTVKKKYCRL